MFTNEATSPDNPPPAQNPTLSDQQPGPTVVATINPDDPPWGVGLAVVVWIASVTILVLMQLAVGLPYIFYKATSGGSTEGLATDPTLIFLSILGVVPAHLLTLLLVWYVVTNRGRRPFWKTLGWDWPRNFRPWKAIGLAILLLALSVAITQLLGGKETQLDQIIASSLKTRFATAFLAVATAPLIEELTFRGVLYPALQRSLGMVWAILIVSALFAGVHVFQYSDNLGVVAAITILSVALTMVRAYTGRLLPSVVMHLVFNGIQAVFLVLQPFIGKSQTENAAAGFLVRSLARLIN